MARLQAIHYARELLKNETLILDTETTGVERSEIIQIAIIDKNGTTLLDTFVKPVNLIPASATRIHGITNAEVQDAPSWMDVAPEVEKILRQHQHLLVYNAIFDRKMMHTSAEWCGAPVRDWKTYIQWVCAMMLYSEYHGESNLRGGYRWQSLEKACTRFSVNGGYRAHSAIGDCYRTLEVIKGMAATEFPE